LKYIKRFESLNNNDLKILAEHIEEFISHYYDNVDYTSSYGDYRFRYTVKEVQQKYFMYLKKIYTPFFEFDIDTIIQNPGWINDTIEKISQFIKFIMDKYSEFERINYSDIDNIIKDISKENYEIYLNALKFNL
jgi:hypothetical protein